MAELKLSSTPHGSSKEIHLPYFLPIGPLLHSVALKNVESFSSHVSPHKALGAVAAPDLYSTVVLGSIRASSFHVHEEAECHGFL